MFKVIIDFFAGDLTGNQLNHDTNTFGKYRQIAVKGRTEPEFTDEEFYKLGKQHKNKLHPLIEWAKTSLEATKGFEYVSFVGVRTINDKPNRGEILPYINPKSREVSDGMNWKYLADSLTEMGYSVKADKKKNIEKAFFKGDADQPSFKFDNNMSSIPVSEFEPIIEEQKDNTAKPDSFDLPE